MTAPHMNPERVEASLVDNYQVSGIDHLTHIARAGVPLDVRPGGLVMQVVYENLSSADEFRVEVWEKASVADVASGRTIVFPKK